MPIKQVVYIEIRAFFWNILGGNKPADVNTFVLTKQGLYFHKTGNQELAACVFADAISYSHRAAESETLNQCKKVFSELNLLSKKRFRSKWHGISKPRFFSFVGFAAPVLAWAIIFTLAAHYDLENNLSEAEREVNRTAPKMLDAETRLDGAKAGPGKKFTYEYTLLSPNDEYDHVAWQKNVVPAIRERITKSRELRPFFKDGVTLVYAYHTGDGALIDEIVVTPEEALRN